MPMAKSRPLTLEHIGSLMRLITNATCAHLISMSFSHPFFDMGTFKFIKLV